MVKEPGCLLVKDRDTCGTMHENYHAETGEPLAPDANRRDAEGKFVGFISWNLCVQNILEGVLYDKWVLLDITKE